MLIYRLTASRLKIDSNMWRFKSVEPLLMHIKFISAAETKEALWAPPAGRERICSHSDLGFVF